MRSILQLVGVLGFLSVAVDGWTVGEKYTYDFNSKTISSLHQVTKQFTGIFIKAAIVIEPTADNLLRLQVQDAVVSSVGKGEDWEKEPKSGFTPMSLRNSTFEIKLDNGRVEEMSVFKDIDKWELNILKGIASQLQVNSHGQNVSMKHPEGVYKLFEDSVTGKCETSYDVSVVNERKRKELSQMPKLDEAELIMEVIKTQNYTKCRQRRAYHFGITGGTSWEPAATRMGQFLTRSNFERAVISGNLRRYVLQSSVVTNKVIISPHIYDREKGMVLSENNMTLRNVTKEGASLPPVESAKTIKSLVYEYNPAEESTKTKPQGGQPMSAKFFWFGSSNQEEATTKRYDEDDSRMEEEQFLQAVPTMELPARVPFFPYSIGYGGNSLGGNGGFDLITSLQRLAIEMAEDLAAPRGLPSAHTLTKFTTMVEVLRTMAYTQLDQLAQLLYQQKGVSGPKYLAWKIFRDAVAQAGNGPTWSLMETWLRQGTVTSEEAAEMFAQLPNTARDPTSQYMTNFFALATSPQVVADKDINATMILAFTDLARKVHVDNRTAHNMYPVHSFAQIAPKGDAAVRTDYVPYLEARLKAAVAASDSKSIQVYSRALGNLAHPAIIDVFRPYLDGQIHVTEFQKSVMVASLDFLCKTYPVEARDLVYTVYQDTENPDNSRVIAIMLLMQTYPPADLLTRMAESTWTEPSEQVASAVSAAIHSASRLATHRSEQLAENAKAAVHLLKKVSYGPLLSKHYIRAYKVFDQNLGYKQDFTYTGSKDSFWPDNIFYNLRRNMGGYKLQYKKWWAMTSNLEQLMKSVKDQFTTQHQNDDDYTDSYWVDKVVTAPKQPEWVEANLRMGILGVNRFLPIDKRSMEALPSVLDSLSNFNTSKLYNQFSMDIGFPLASGLPFFYTMAIPTYFRLEGKLNTNLEKDMKENKTRMVVPDNLTISSCVKFVYSLKTQSYFGFVNPLDNHSYTSGVEKVTNLQLPEMTVNATYDTEESRLSVAVEPAFTNGSYPLFEYSTQLYTSKRDIFDMRAPSEQNEYERVMRKPLRHTEMSLGEKSLGLSLEVRSLSEDGWPKKEVLSALSSHDLVSAWLYPYAEPSLTNSNLTLVYNPEKSDTRNFSIDLRTGWIIGDCKETMKMKKKSRGKKHERVAQNHDSETSEFLEAERWSNFYGQAACSGGPTLASRVAMIEYNVTTSGKKNTRHLGNIALTKNYEASSLRLLASHLSTSPQEKPYQVTLNTTYWTRQTNLYNLNSTAGSPLAMFEAKLDFGKKSGKGSQISLKGTAEQSWKSWHDMMTSLESEACYDHGKNTSNLINLCSTIMDTSLVPDRINISINYRDVPQALKSTVFKMYEVGRDTFSPYAEEDIFQRGSDGLVTADIAFSDDFGQTSMVLRTPSWRTVVSDFPVASELKPLLKLSPKVGLLERYCQQTDLGKFHHRCSFDRNQLRTVYNETYPMDARQCTHVLMHVVDATNRPKFSITLETNEKGKPILVYREGAAVHQLKHTTEYDVDIKGRSPHVLYKVDGKGSGGLFKQIWSLPNHDFTIVEALNQDLRIFLNGETVNIEVGMVQKENVLGACGLNGRQGKAGCQREEATSSYAVGNCPDWKRNLRHKMEEEGCTDPRATTLVEAESKEGSGGQCSQYLTHGMFHQSSICFSIKPHLFCGSGCRPVTNTTKAVEFHCLEDSAPARHWLEMVRKGATPDFSRKGANKRIDIELAETCALK